MSPGAWRGGGRGGSEPRGSGGLAEPAGAPSASIPQAGGRRGVPAGPDVAGPDVAAGERAVHCPALRPEGARPQPLPRPGAARGTARTAPEPGGDPASRSPRPEAGPGGGARSRVGVLLSREPEPERAATRAAPVTAAPERRGQSAARSQICK